jgi:hypothetical protein
MIQAVFSLVCVYWAQREYSNGVTIHKYKPVGDQDHEVFGMGSFGEYIHNYTGIKVGLRAKH